MLKRILPLTLAFLVASVATAASKVLLVADEFPAMRTLVAALETGGIDPQLECSLVSQDDLPADLQVFDAVFVYIHGSLKADPEQAFIQYARDGGRLILLHHSISSGKRKNQDWFGFLGVELPEGDVVQGGYEWREGVPLQVFATSDHFITSHRIQWLETVEDGAGKVRPAETFEDSEVYLNHVMKGPRTILLGLRYSHPVTGRTYVQETAGWVRRAGRGWLFYFMPGHGEREFQSPVYRQILVNTLLWKPDPA